MGRNGVTALACALLGREAAAHPTQFTTLQLEIDPGGEYRGTLNIDILSYALGQTSQDTSNEELQALPRRTAGRAGKESGRRGRAGFNARLVIRTDAGATFPATWNLPGLPEGERGTRAAYPSPILMPGEIDFSGRLPAGARTVSVRLPYIMADTVQVYELPNGDSHDEPVTAGGYSSEIALGVTVPPVTARSDRLARGGGGSGRTIRGGGRGPCGLAVVFATRRPAGVIFVEGKTELRGPTKLTD